MIEIKHKGSELWLSRNSLTLYCGGNIRTYRAGQSASGIKCSKCSSVCALGLIAKEAMRMLRDARFRVKLASVSPVYIPSKVDENYF